MKNYWTQKEKLDAEMIKELSKMTEDDIEELKTAASEFKNENNPSFIELIKKSIEELGKE